MQRKEAARSGRGMAPRAPTYPVYTPPSRPSVPETYDTYEAEKKKSFAKYGLLSNSRVWLLTDRLQALTYARKRYATREEVQDHGYLRESPW